MHKLTLWRDTAPGKRHHYVIFGHAIVDDEDWERVRQFRWLRNRHGAQINAKCEDGVWRPVLLHRFILGLEHGNKVCVDHINRDPLDNRRANLRLVTKGENAHNVTPCSWSSSQYRGVSWYKKNRKWIAHVRVNGKLHYLGYFTDEEEAAAVAKEFRIAHLSGAVD